MTVTTTTLTSRRAAAVRIGWPSVLGRTVGAEWTKLRSVRSTYGSLLAALVVTAGIAALAITTEFATGSIRTTLAATPARWAITTAVAVLFAPPILGALVSNETVSTVMDDLPAGLTTVLVSGTGERYGPELAALLLGAWAIAGLAVGTITLHRRDP
jgi:ABC-2 type transport system permease protein